MPPTPDHTSWRVDLATRLARAYAGNPNAAVTMIAGSTGRGTADAWSDIEIDVYYTEPPTQAERISAVERSGATLVQLDHDSGEWEEQMTFGGFPVATSTFLVSTMERWIGDVVDRCDSNENAQMRLSSLQRAVPVTGEDISSAWKERVSAYPDGLVDVMLDENLYFGGLFRNAEMWLERNDDVACASAIVEASKRLMRALHGLNRVYLPTPDAIRHLDEVAAGLDIKPRDLAARLREVVRASPREAYPKIESLIREVLDLVARHRPGFDVSDESRGLVQRRHRWTDPPQGFSPK